LLFLFENFALDTGRRELRHGAELRPVEPQVFDLLAYLIKNRDRVASKDDLIASIWGGRAVSDSTLTTRLNAARRAIGDRGSEQRLIKTLPRKGVRFVGAVREEQFAGGAMPPGGAAEAPRFSLSLPDRPSIAVLPFTNMSGATEQEYFADGIVEEIITALSRFSSLFVIARNSSFMYRGRAVSVKQVGRELGVRYLLEGSVRNAARQLRITGQLIDAADGAHLWADRFDGVLEDIFNLQDRVTTSVVTAIVPKLEQAEIHRAKRKPTENLNAYDYFLRGMASYHHYNKDANSEALALFLRATELDPEFAAAHSMAARCYQMRRAHRWMGDPVREAAEAIRLARQAVKLGWDDAVALCNGGMVIDSIARDPEAGAVLIDRARTLNPNLASAWLASGWVRVHLGNSEVAIGHFAQAMRLSPLDKFMCHMQTGTAFAHCLAGRNGEAASWAERALREDSNWLPALRIATVSNALAGRLDCARKAMARLRELDPAFQISNVKDFALFAPEDLTRLEEGFRKAGLPE
jgi:TolB-like protein